MSETAEVVSDTKEKIEKSKKLEGVKTEAQNKEVIESDKKKKKEVSKEPEEIALPQFFIDSQKRHKVTLDVLFDKKKGNVVSITRAGIGVDFTKFSEYGHREVSFEFTQPNYDELCRYRQRCSAYDRDAKQVLMNSIQLRNFLLVWHLKDWSLQDASGKKVELKHDQDGSLSTESVNAVYTISPTLMDVAMTCFEKDCILT